MSLPAAPPSPADAPAADTPLYGELRRCPTCNRWGGIRQLSGDGLHAELDPAQVRGPCREGPWHGSMRGLRNACGQWLRWVALPAPDPADDSPSSTPVSGAASDPPR